MENRALLQEGYLKKFLKHDGQVKSSDWPGNQREKRPNSCTPTKTTRYRVDSVDNESAGRSLVPSDVIFRQQPMTIRGKGSVSMCFSSQLFLFEFTKMIRST